MYHGFLKIARLSFIVKSVALMFLVVLDQSKLLIDESSIGILKDIELIFFIGLRVHVSLFFCRLCRIAKRKFG